MHVHVIHLLIAHSEIHGNTIQIFQTNSGTSKYILWGKRTVIWFFFLKYEKHWKIHFICSCLCALEYLINRCFNFLNIGIHNTLMSKTQIKVIRNVESESSIPVVRCLHPDLAGVQSLPYRLWSCVFLPEPRTLMNQPNINKWQPFNML